MYVCMYVCMYLCVYVYIYICKHIYIYVLYISVFYIYMFGVLIPNYIFELLSPPWTRCCWSPKIAVAADEIQTRSAGAEAMQKVALKTIKQGST